VQVVCCQLKGNLVAFIVAKQVNIEGGYILDMVIGARAHPSLQAMRCRCCNCNPNVYFASVDGQRT